MLTACSEAEGAQSSVTALPGGLQAELRAYQEDGFVWAMCLAQAGPAFAARSWHTLIADESQAVKNALAKRSQALFDIEAD